MEEKGLPKCFKGTEHQGDYLIEMQRFETNHSSGEEYVVYWCEECGACVVDVEYDGRMHHHKIPMKFSKTLLEKIQN